MRPRHPITCLDARPTPTARQADAARIELALIAAGITTAALLLILAIVLCAR